MSRIRICSVSRRPDSGPATAAWRRTASGHRRAVRPGHGPPAVHHGRQCDHHRANRRRRRPRSATARASRQRANLRVRHRRAGARPARLRTRAAAATVHRAVRERQRRPDPVFESAFRERCTIGVARERNDAVANSDVVITATPGGGPLFDADAVQPGTHLTCGRRYRRQARAAGRRAGPRADFRGRSRPGAQHRRVPVGARFATHGNR